MNSIKNLLVKDDDIINFFEYFTYENKEDVNEYLDLKVNEDNIKNIFENHPKKMNNMCYDLLTIITNNMSSNKLNINEYKKLLNKYFKDISNSSNVALSKHLISYLSLITLPTMCYNNFKIFDKKLGKIVLTEFHPDNLKKSKLIPYPEIDDLNFNNIINNKKEFHDNFYNPMIKDKIEDICSRDKVFNLQNQQKFLKNYINPITPYNGILIFHGTGAGKTCTAITIAEQFIDNIKKNPVPEQRKCLFIYPGTSIEENFKDGLYSFTKEKDELQYKLVHGTRQCTGDKYYIPKSNFDSNEERIKAIEKGYKENYEFMGKQELTNKIKEIINNANETYKTHINAQTQIETEISNYFSNRVIIIDEIHNFKKIDKMDDTNENIEDFKPIDALHKIIKISNNIKLILMSATPMFDKSIEIIDIINLLLENDRRPLLNYKNIFKLYEDNIYRITSNGAKILKNIIKPYISYFRGENPITFPKELSPDDSSIKNLYKVNMYLPKPKFDFKNNKLNNAHWIKYTSLIKCEMSDNHFKHYNEYIMSTITSDVAYNKSQELSNIVYPVDKNLNCLFSTEGFQLAFTTIKEHEKYQYKYFNNNFLKEDNLYQYSAKFYHILQNVKKSPGISFIYLEHLETGVYTMSMILEEAGYEPYNGAPLIRTNNVKKICSICNKYYNDHNKSDDHQFTQAKYIKLTGQQASSSRQTLISKTKEYENRMGKNIKVIIGSKVAIEGVDFSNIRQIHLGNIWHNMSRLIQIEGRGIRFCSHVSLDDKDSNVIIFRYCVSSNKKNDYKIETIDEKIWREAESKDIAIKEVETILKENSIDCVINKNANYFPKYLYQDKGDTDYSRKCNYQKCGIRCNVKKQTKNKIDESTYEFAEENSSKIQTIKKIIKNLISGKLYYSIKELIEIIEDKYQFSKHDLAIAIDELKGNLNSIYPEIIYHKDIPGYILDTREFIIFQPLKPYNHDIPFEHRDIQNYNNIVNSNLTLNNIFSDKKNINTQSNIFNINNLLKETSNLNDQAEISYIIEHKFFKYSQNIIEHIIEYIITNKITNPDELDNNYKYIFNHFKSSIFKKDLILGANNSNEKYYGYYFIDNNPRCYKNGSFLDCDFKETRIINSHKIELKQPNRDIYGFLIEKDNKIQFKIVDKRMQKSKIRLDSKMAMNTIITGKVCETFDKKILQRYMKLFNISNKNLNRKNICKQIEISMRNKDLNNTTNHKWFYNLEEWKIYIKNNRNKID